MSQHDYNLANQSGANFRADLNNALGAIATNNSGSSEPSTTFAYEWWVDTSNNVLKIRNSANNAWITLPISVTADNTVDINGGTVNGISSFSFSSGSTVTTILDEDNLASDSATALATQQSIKAYVDSQVTAQDLDISDGSSSISIDLDSESLGLLGGTGLTSTASGNNVTFAIGQAVGTGDNVQFNQVTSALVGNASTATALATARAIALSGDVVGTANFDGTAGITISTTIQANSVALGTDTTGNYVATIAGTTNEIEVSGSGSETAGVTVGLPDDVTIAGNLTVNGTTTTVNTSTLSVEDPLIKLANSNSGADSVDIGFYGLYDTSGAQDLYAGLFRDANDSGKFKLFKDLQAEPTTTVNTSGTGYAVGTLVSNLEGNITSTLTSDLNFADGNKAVFGSNSDLEIYHTGTESIIADTGTGHLFIRGQNLLLQNADGSKAYLVGSGDVTTLYYGTSAKLATTSAGVDISGTVTADGLTVNGNIAVSASSGDTLTLTKSTTEPSLRLEGDANKDFVFAISGELLTLTQNDGATDIVTFDHDTRATNFKGTVTASGAVSAEDNIYLTDAGTIRGRVELNSSDRDDLDIKAVSLGSNIKFFTADSEVGRFESSGSLLIGQTAGNVYNQSSTAGFKLDGASGNLQIARSGGTTAFFNRMSSDGDIIDFRKDGSTAGSIGVNGGRLNIGSDDTHIFFDSGDSPSIRPHNGSSATDGVIDIGESGTRFKDLHLSGTAYTSSITTPSGDLTLDVAGDIILDADGGDIKFQDAGTHWLNFGNAAGSSAVHIDTKVSNHDLKFRGNDGGSIITALTLDMSDAGTALFNNKVGIGTSSPSKQLTISGDDAEFLLNRTGSYADTINMGMPGGVPTIVGGTHLAFGGSGTWTEQMRLTSTGLGIGTSSPNTPLQVSGANSSTNADALFSVQKTTEGYGLFSGVLGTGTSWLQGGTANDATDYSIALQPNGGNVGIGTTSPDSNLHIKTSVDNSVAQGLVIERSANTDKGYINYNGGGFQFRSTVGDPIVFGDTSNEQMRLTSTGLGIGTTASRPLHVVGADGGLALFSNNVDADLNIQTASAVTLISPSTGTLAFGTSSTERARLTSTGLAIGTTDAKTTLTVLNPTAPTFDNDTHAGESIFIRSGGSAGSGNAQGVLAFGKADSSALRSGSAIASVQTNSDVDKVGLGFYTSDGSASSQTLDQRMLLTHIGNLGIGISPTEKLHVDGNILATGSITENSDERLKENIKTLDGSKVLEMRGVSYTKDGKASSGVIAQELEKVAPELVHTAKDEMATKSVAYGNLIGYLIQGMKEQQELIKDLQTQINNLRGK